MLRKRALLTVGLILASACAVGPPPSDEPLVHGTTVPRSYTVAVTGDENFTFSGLVPVRILTTPRLEIPESIRLLSVGLLAPVELDDGRLLRTAFDLLGYREPGRYEFGPGSEKLPGFDPPEALESNVFVDLFDPPALPVSYKVLRAICGVEVGEDAFSGSLDCPRVAREDGDGEIALRVVWTAA